MPHDISHWPASPVRSDPCGPGDTRGVVRRWQALVDARRIGNIPPTPPAAAAQRAASDALFANRAARPALANREYGL